MKKVKSVALDASLLAEAEKEAERRSITFSALVEEALKLYLSVGRIEERLANIETLLMQCLQKETRREPAGQPTEAQRQEPLGGNVWVEVLRRRG